MKNPYPRDTDLTRSHIRRRSFFLFFFSFDFFSSLEFCFLSLCLLSECSFFYIFFFRSSFMLWCVIIFSCCYRRFFVDFFSSSSPYARFRETVWGKGYLGSFWRLANSALSLSGRNAAECAYSWNSGIFGSWQTGCRERVLGCWCWSKPKWPIGAQNYEDRGTVKDFSTSSAYFTEFLQLRPKVKLREINNPRLLFPN